MSETQSETPWEPGKTITYDPTPGEPTPEPASDADSKEQARKDELVQQGLSEADAAEQARYERQLEADKG